MNLWVGAGFRGFLLVTVFVTSEGRLLVCGWAVALGRPVGCPVDVRRSSLRLGGREIQGNERLMLSG
jgi:hypothetical protein